MKTVSKFFGLIALRYTHAVYMKQPLQRCFHVHCSPKRALTGGFPEERTRNQASGAFGLYTEAAYIDPGPIRVTGTCANGGKGLSLQA